MIRQPPIDHERHETHENKERHEMREKPTWLLENHFMLFVSFVVKRLSENCSWGVGSASK